MAKKRAMIPFAVACASLALVAALILCLVASGSLCITSTMRPRDAWQGAVPAPSHTADADNDGIPDGEDILNGALAYIQTRPRYKSAYYVDGWPDDGCGVCTDVVAIALHGAGYDLPSLIEADIARAPEAYEIAEPDPAIDFRRVANQRSYFERHAVALPTDPAETESWQPGDIVVYEDHVGIASDRRNSRGIPFLVHHSGPFQFAYEEDCLASYGTIVGHFRMGTSV